MMTVYESITVYIKSYRESVEEFEKADGINCTELRGIIRGLELAREQLTVEAAKCEIL